MVEKKFKHKLHTPRSLYNKKEVITECDHSYTLQYRYEKGKLTCCSIFNIRQINNKKEKKYNKFKSRASKYRGSMVKSSRW